MPQEQPIPLRYQCPKKWSELVGEGDRRHCQSCNLDVHNLSLMTRERAHAVLAQRDGRKCIAYHCDAKGDVLFASSGNRAMTAPWARWLAHVGALLALSFPFLVGCRKAPGHAPTSTEAADAGDGAAAPSATAKAGEKSDKRDRADETLLIGYTGD